MAGEKPIAPLKVTSLGCLSENNAFRRWAYGLVNSNGFNYTMSFLILVSCTAMVYEHPGINKGSIGRTFLWHLDVVLTAMSGVETVLRVVVFSFWVYFKSLANKVRHLMTSIDDHGLPKGYLPSPSNLFQMALLPPSTTGWTKPSAKFVLVTSILTSM